MELILKEYDELKKDEKYKIQKKRHEELHRKLSELKKVIQEYDQLARSNTTKVSVGEYKRMQKEAASVHGHFNGDGTVMSDGTVMNDGTIMNGCDRSGHFNHWSQGGLVPINGTNVIDEDDPSDSDGGHFLSDDDDDDLSFGSNTNGVMIRNS